MAVERLADVVAAAGGAHVAVRVVALHEVVDALLEFAVLGRAGCYAASDADVLSGVRALETAVGLLSQEVVVRVADLAVDAQHALLVAALGAGAVAGGAARREELAFLLRAVRLAETRQVVVGLEVRVARREDGQLERGVAVRQATKPLVGAVVQRSASVVVENNRRGSLQEVVLLCAIHLLGLVEHAVVAADGVDRVLPRR